MGNLIPQCWVLAPLWCLLQLLKDGGCPSYQAVQLRQATLPLLIVVQRLWPGQHQHVAEGLVHHYVGLGRSERREGGKGERKEEGNEGEKGRTEGGKERGREGEREGVRKGGRE